MKTLGSRYALAQLKSKRASLAGEIASLKKKLDWAEEALRHVDATLIVFDPTIFPASIPARRDQKRVKLFRQGELGNRILRALRLAGSPQSIAEIVEAVVRHAKFDEDAYATMAPRIRSNLSYLRAVGRVEKAGTGRKARWSIPVQREVPISQLQKPVLLVAGNEPPAPEQAALRPPGSLRAAS
jgi:hypothetical protein